MTLDLPVPPSMNHYWRNIGPGRTIISKKGREYREDVIARSWGCKRFTGPLEIAIDFYPPDKRRRDLDNLLKPLLDALAHGGVYEDDSQIDDLRIRRRGKDHDGGRVIVSILEVAP